jgi:4-diphosphocytidyl-2-C-methyl-D-erythritol kinase
VPTQAQLTLFSPIKVNLYLRIVGKRPDGYHDLETVMTPLDFGDTLTFTPQPSGITLACDHPGLPTDDSNLVVRAAKLLAQSFGVTTGAHIVLQKRAPLAAGVGGGSSNAAITLLGLSQLWRLPATPTQLGDLAAQMGSDINFFLGHGPALCRGRGEQVDPIASRFSACLLLVNPGFGISTKWAYQAWAKAVAQAGAVDTCAPKPPGTAVTTTAPGVVAPVPGRTESGARDGELTASPPDVTLLTRALAAGDLAGVSRNLFNSLETPSVGKFPVLELLKRAMRNQGAAGALMSGSGASVFGLFADAAMAARCGEQIRAEFGPSMWTCVTRCKIGAVE